MVDTSSLAVPEAAAPGRKRRRRGRAFGPLVALSIGWLALVVVLAILEPWLPLPDPDKPGTVYSLVPFADSTHLLGTDQLGRDTLARIISGARISLAVALGATTLGLVVGGLIGIVAGYFRGVVDSFVSVLTNVMLAFPALIFLIVLASMLTPSLQTLVLGLAAIGVPTFARVARANTIALANREFVLAARSIGANNLRIVLRELVPNVALSVLSFGLLVSATLMVAEGSLSFLNLGVPPPQASWGGMIAAAQDELQDNPHLVVVPGACFFLTVFALNRLGDYVRDRFGREAAV